MSNGGVSINTNVAEIKRIAKILRDKAGSVKPAERRKIIRPAAELVVKTAKSLVPVSDAPHHRVKDGKRIATYYPGNLKRSIRVLGHLGKLSGKVFIGPARATGDSSGVFRGRRVDGYYMAIVERKKPYLRPAFNQHKEQVERIITEGIKRKMLNGIG